MSRERFEDDRYRSHNFEIVLIVERGEHVPTEAEILKVLEKGFGQMEEGAVRVVEI